MRENFPSMFVSMKMLQIARVSRAFNGGHAVAHMCADRHSRVHLGVISHASSDIYFPVESGICGVLNVSIQCLFESLLCCVIKSFLIAYPTLFTFVIDGMPVIPECESPGVM